MTDPKPAPSPIPFLRSHRRCGCDCRDKDTYSADPYLLNPSCCTECQGGGKPPCAYLAHFECEARCFGHRIGYNPVVLRPNCEFTDKPGIYVAPADSDQVNGEGFQDGCSWFDRLGHIVDAEWSLDLDSGTLTHLAGFIYRPIAKWDCYGPNTLKLQSTPYIVTTRDIAGPIIKTVTPPTCAGLPPFVCVTPPITRRVYKAGCCANCFNVTLPEIDNLLIPQQVVSFLPNSGFAINAPSGDCNYSQNYINHTRVNGFSSGVQPIQLAIWNNSNGSPRSARLDILILYVDGHTDLILYATENFSCSGGSLSLVTANASFPKMLTVTSHDCVSSESDDEGPCSDGSAIRPGYADETERCECCDQWCQCAPGAINIFCTSPGTVSYCSGQFCVGGPSGKVTHSGPTRQFCCTVTDSTLTSHTICASIYCGQGVWTADWYLDGVYVDFTGISTTCCPMTGRAPMPDMGIGCTGCLAIGTQPSCSPPPPAHNCCAAGDEAGTCHLTFTSSCTTFNGHTIVMTRTGTGLWNGSLSGYTITIACMSNDWQLSITNATCSVTLHASSATCTPFMDGVFPSGLFSCFFASTCSTGDTISAVMSV